jgi:pimeloyl-ACP methyl ester carboxylesterase
MTLTRYFLHGLDSSGSGTKGRFFAKHFPEVIRPNFSGSLEERLEQFTRISEEAEWQLIGSSYGGLMAVHLALAHIDRVRSLILLAPALNFEGFAPPRERLAVQTFLLIGKNDTVTPIDPVIKLAEQTFSNLDLHIVDDDHLLHRSFSKLPWKQLLP